MSLVIRALALVAAFLALVSAAPAEIIVKTDSLPTGAIVAPRNINFTTTTIANLLTAPVDGLIVGVQLSWGSLSGNAAPEETIAIHILQYNGTFVPGGPLATIESPILVDGGINEFRFIDPSTNTIPLSVPVTAGSRFFVALELVSLEGGPDVPSLLMDDDGLQGFNTVRDGQNWIPFTIGIQNGGDLGMRAIIQPVPEPSTYVLAAIGGVGLLAFRRRKSMA